MNDNYTLTANASASRITGFFNKKETLGSFIIEVPFSSGEGYILGPRSETELTKSHSISKQRRVYVGGNWDLFHCGYLDIFNCIL